MIRKANLSIWLLVWLLVAVLAKPAGAVTHYVDPNGSADFTTIQAAIDDANDDDEIEVAAGTYNEAVNFNGKAIRLYSSGGPDVTIIDGTGSYHVVQCISGEDASTILDGFTIADGNACGVSWPHYHGGGMLNISSSPTVSNCKFTENSSQHWGGGMYNDQGSHTTLINCTFSGNISDVGGGGIGNFSSSPRVTNCTFSGNNSPDGGGMYNSGSSNPMVTNCILWGDSPDEIYDSGASTTTVTYSNVQGGWPDANNTNIDADPRFVDVAGGDLRLTYMSPCVDNGDNNAPNLPATDLAGNPRVMDGDGDTNAVVDMGAFEFYILPVHNITKYRWYETIQGAIDDANDGDQIEVAPGTYNEAVNFNGKAIRLYSSGGPELTTIDGTGNYHVVQCINGEEPNTIIEGFTIRGGTNGGRGGGIYCENSSPTVKNSTFTNNSAVYGGGMCNNYSHPTVTGCTFSYNTATHHGGGMYNFNNSSPTVTNCAFGDNNAYDNGGGMYNRDSSSPTVTDCTFCGNSAVDGGGIYNYNGSNPTVTKCTFSNNVANYSGGGMYNCYSNTTVTNCTFSGNTATFDGGGIYNYNGSNPTVTNCTFTGNTASNSGGGMGNYTTSSPTVTNCILWGNTPDEICDDATSSSTVTYSDVQGGWPGAGNINISPFFIDVGTGDLRLTWYSPCIDIGDNNAPSLPATDMDGNPRVVDGDGDGNSVVDMGAYELEASKLKIGIGTLAVTIEPNEAIDTGAKWKVEGGEQWYNSGDVVTLPPGYYKVEVNELAAWYEPETLLVGYDTTDSNEVLQQTLWVRVIGDMNTTVTAEYKPVPVFDIGQIPPRDAPHGRRQEFGVDANWLGDAVLYSFTTTFDPNYPEPEGPISFDVNSGLFTYEPNDNKDGTAFTVTFRAESGADSNEQAVKITPIPDLPPEYSIFTEPVQDWPDPCDHIFVNEIDSDEPQILNGIEHTEVRSVTIAGKIIEVADVPYNPVYVYSGKLDINDLTIYAETVVISDPLHLPQTRVTIYARELIFEGAADINTTPEDGRPVGTEKLDGLSAADISLYIESYEADGGLNGRFIMNGTRGYNGGRFGDDGLLTCTLDNPQPLAWLTPYALKMVIAHARDAYLYRYTADAHDTLSEYAGLLTAYRALPEWNDLDGDWQYEFGQMHQEVVTLVYRMQNWMDYFGNPPGWTPMLSFEVWKAAYEDEIERGIRVLYLSYWLQNIADDITAKADALEGGRTKLWEETVQFKDYYQTVAEIIETLKTQASNIVNRVGGCGETSCWGLMGELKDKEDELMERAHQIVEERHKVPWWKKAINSIGTAYTSTLEGFKSGGKVGGAAAWELERMRMGREIVDELFGDTFAVLKNRTDVADRFNSIDFDQATNGCLDVYDDIEDLSDIEGGAEGYLSALKDSTSQIADGLNDVKEALMTTSLDNEEVQTELEKIKASDPVFRRLIDQAVELMLQKEVFNRQLAAAMQKVSTLSNGITNNILSIDAMNRQVSLQNRVFDRRALMYVKDMELRARARLLKYHYYMAKAYEYRTLQRYEWPLDIQGVFDRIATIAASDPNHILSPTDYNNIKGVYDGLMSEIRDRILELYSYEQEKEIDLLYGITTLDMPEQIARLNAGQTAKIDLLDLIDQERENVRIVDMSVDDVILTSDPPYPAQGNCELSYVAVKMEHSGICSLQKGKDTYRFSYPETEKGIKWESDCYVRGDIEDSTPSYASESMLRALLPDLSDAQVMFYSRPALWSDIGVYRNVTLTPTCSDVDIESLTLRIKYDYTSRNSGDVTLHVGTFPGELRPYFTLDKTDESEDGRRDGIGDFYRTYTAATSVTVTAPVRYGDYEFRWWYCKGGSSPFYSYDRVLDVDWMTDGGRLYTVEAEYEYVGPLCPGDVNADLNVDLRDFSILAAAWLTELGDPGWDEYCDISSPADYRIDLHDVKVLCDNWLTDIEP